MDELTLTHAARRGDLQAFNDLILANQDFLFSVAARILGDDEAAADVVQEAMLSAFRNFNSFRGGPLRHWLGRIVINACYDELRRRNRHRTVALEALNEEGEEVGAAQWLADPAPGPEQRYETRELRRAAQACIQSLAPGYRTALILVDVEDRSYAEAAALMGIPVNTLKSRLARARMGMVRQLRGFSDQLPAPFAERAFA